MGDQEKGVSTAPAAGLAPDTGIAAVVCPLGHFLWYFLRLGTFGFGGLARTALRRCSMNERRLVSTVSDFLHVHFLWFLLGSYAVAALWPTFGLWIR